jgi:hypothetical protein
MALSPHLILNISLLPVASLAACLGGLYKPDSHFLSTPLTQIHFSIPLGLESSTFKKDKSCVGEMD